MDDFTFMPKGTDFEAQKKEVLQKCNTYPLNEPIIEEIKLAQTMEDLESICRFMNSLSIFLAKVNITGKKYDYSVYLRCLADAVEVNDLILSGADTSSEDHDLVKKYGLE